MTETELKENTSKSFKASAICEKPIPLEDENGVVPEKWPEPIWINVTHEEYESMMSKSFKSCAICEKIKEEIECYQCLTCYAYCCKERCMFKHNSIHIPRKVKDK